MNAIRQTTRPSELSALRALSARLGGDPLLTQASSGNTSIKMDGVLWIKASGKWLIQADEEDFLLPVPLEEAQQCLLKDRTTLPTEPSTQGRACASIETAMHAVMPQRVVIHVHSVSTIAWAVREDGQQQLNTRLAGLPWQWIPYTPSGAPLARKIGAALADDPSTSIFVLGNHGLVVGGNSCSEAELLLAEVEERLAVEARLVPTANDVGLPFSLDARVCSLATDPHSQRILNGGVLYPCQALFLPGTCGSASAFSRRESESYHQPITRAEQEMLVGLANIVQRIDPAAPLRYLTIPEIEDIMNDAGEQYRRCANTNGAPLQVL